MITKMISKTSLVSVLLVSLAIGCGADDDDDRDTPIAQSDSDLGTEAEQSIAGLVAETETFSTLLAAVDAAGLVGTLDGDGPFTVFAPSDAAFAKLPQATLEALLLPENKQKLTNILLFHVVPGQYLAKDVLASSQLSSAFGQPLSVDAGAVTVAGSAIVQTDILANNGVVHVIDTVMIPDDITQIASKAGFSTLVAALEAADLVETLQGDGPFTVFAPTDEAFAKLPEGTLESLLLPENKQQLIDILTYHVVAANLKAADVLASSELVSVQGSQIQVSNDGAAKVNDASITATDIIALNGTIHVIDTVILPPSE